MPTYDLEERIEKFCEEVIIFLKSLKFDPITSTIKDQLARSVMSVGANYMEANNACSEKDFKNKIFICKKEIQETKHWLRMISVCQPDKKEITSNLLDEVQQLIKIFHKISSTLQKKSYSIGN